MEKALHLYGDMIFDLCDSLLWDPVNAQESFRRILKDVTANIAENAYEKNERAWVLKTACDQLKRIIPLHARRPNQAEQLEMASAGNVAGRLKLFDRFFHRLTEDEQMLLLLKDKYGLPYGEISVAMGLPEGTLRVKRSQALRALETWLWETETTQ